MMILVTGGTGFVGRALARQLVANGESVRILLRPSPLSPNLPRGVSVEVVVCSLSDERGLQAAMKGVNVVYHLAGSERRGTRADLLGVDVNGARTLARAAMQAGVERVIYLSHLGADRFSAYPVLKAKAIAENYLMHSGVGYTIFRSAIIYGENDQFSTMFARLLKLSPGLFLLPGGGNTLLQPIWVEDLVTCMIYALDDAETVGQIISVGGTEYFSFRQIIEILMEVTATRRRLVSIQPAYLRMITLLIEQFIPRFPVSIFWLDYLAADRTTALDSVPRLFGLMPARFQHHLGYLRS
ncbi:MAG: NAD(P)H-binding protein [Anaerolineae bacterium]|nr:NAD(P)H-binding protein [Anaerolineae bacterium]